MLWISEIISFSNIARSMECGYRENSVSTRREVLRKRLCLPYATDFIGTESTKQGSYNRTEYRQTSYDGSILISYGNAIGVHTYNFIGGAQLFEDNSEDEGYSAIGYITDQFSNPNFSNSYPEGERPHSSVDKQRSASFLFKR